MTGKGYGGSGSRQRGDWVFGADIGGTFTDVVLTAPDGSLTAVKQLTTPEAPERGVVSAMRRALEETGAEPASIRRVVHGTTLAANALIERKGARVAFVTTRGFGDLLRIGRTARVEDDRYDLHFEEAEPPIAKDHIFEVSERVDARGNVLQPLAIDDVHELVAAVARCDPEAVALCLMHSYANPSHEERIAAELRSSLPDTLVIESSRVHPEIREFDRACTTLFTAEVAPLMARYLARLEVQLRELGIDAPLYVMESSGGVMSARVAAERAVATLESGAAAGVIAAARFASHHGLARVISFDMGGTTAKAGVVHDSLPRVVRELHVGGKGSFGGRRAGTGLPVKTPTVDVAEVGAGGGSIAWLDAEGLLRVGPTSAGADPGPVCYGRGGRAVTVTDANLVLGYLDPDRFGSGAMKLDDAAARAAVEEQLARPLSVSIERAAWAVHDAANANMASAIHVVTVQRGLDPREHTLVAFGGAGPMHMAGVAERFDIDRLIAPPAAGVAAAVGMQASDLRAEYGRSVLLTPATLDAERARSLFAGLESAALSRMGFDRAPADLVVERFVEARFEGQAHELPVPLCEFSSAALAAIENDFRELYRREYAVAPLGAVEYGALRVRLCLPVSAPPLPPADGGTQAEATPRLRRPAWFGSAGGSEDALDTAVYERAGLAAGDEFPGPAIIEGRVETIVVPPPWRARVDDVGSVALTRTR